MTEEVTNVRSHKLKLKLVTLDPYIYICIYIHIYPYMVYLWLLRENVGRYITHGSYQWWFEEKPRHQRCMYHYSYILFLSFFPSSFWSFWCIKKGITTESSFGEYCVVFFPGIKHEQILTSIWQIWLKEARIGMGMPSHLDDRYRRLWRRVFFPHSAWGYEHLPSSIRDWQVESESQNSRCISLSVFHSR